MPFYHVVYGGISKFHGEDEFCLPGLQSQCKSWPYLQGDRGDVPVISGMTRVRSDPFMAMTNPARRPEGPNARPLDWYASNCDGGRVQFLEPHQRLPPMPEISYHPIQYAVLFAGGYENWRHIQIASGLRQLAFHSNESITLDPHHPRQEYYLQMIQRYMQRIRAHAALHPPHGNLRKNGDQD